MRRTKMADRCNDCDSSSGCDDAATLIRNREETGDAG